MLSTKKRSRQKAFTLKNSRSETRSPKRSRHPFSFAQKIILAVIIAVVVIVTAFTIFVYKYDSRAQVEIALAKLSQSYYEDYYYLGAFKNDEALAANYLSRYTQTGLSSVSLRQLILSSPATTPSIQEFLEKRCDVNTTSVHYIPESPYRKNSYRAEFNYSCNFE